MGVGPVFKKFITTGVAVAVAAVAFTVSHIPSAFATDSDNATCAAIDPARGGTARNIPTDTNLDITAVAGESITIVTADGAPIDLFLPVGAGPRRATLASGAPYSVPVDGDYSTARPGRAGMPPASATCSAAPAAGGGTSNSAAQDAVSSIIIGSNNNAITGAVNDAVGGAFGGGTSGYIAQNSFSLSTRGAAALLQSKNAVAVKELEKKTATGVYGADVDLNSIPDATLWNVWITGRYDHFDGDNNAFDGHVANVVVGADYKISETMLIGLLGGYANTDMDTLLNGVAGNVESDGFTVGAYVGAQLEGSIVAHGFVAYTGSDYDVINGGNTGSFDADRLTGGVRVNGSMPMDGYTIQPTLAFSISNEDQEAYVDSAANAIASNDITSGRLSLGPKIIFDPMATDTGEISPWVAVNYDYDFSDSNAPATTGAPDLGDISSASVEAGFTSKIGDAELTASGRVGGLGSGEYTSYGGTIKLRVPLD